MGGKIGRVLAVAAVALLSRAADAQTPAGVPGLARSLIQGCLRPPSMAGVAQLAFALGAKPYSEARRRRELKTDTTIFPEASTPRDQRTKTTVTEFRGWDLPGPGAGTLEYSESRTETDWLERKTRQPVTPVRVDVSRSCSVHAPVANAGAIFEMYEGLSDRDYGMRISADRRWIDVFSFDPDRFDAELSFDLEAPLAGLAPDRANAEGRLILTDGGPRFIGGPAKGIPTIELTRSTVLAALNRPATMSFFNAEITPVVQRLAAAQSH